MEYDLILIQPPLFRNDNIVSENMKIEYDYWVSMEDYAGKLLGDLPVEASYGILSIASYLKSKKFKVKILDFHMMDYMKRTKFGKAVSIEDIENEICIDRAAFWGISMMTISEEWANAITNLIRKFYQSSYIFAGGYYPTYNYKNILQKNRNYNFIALNEGELVLENIINTYKKKGIMDYSINGIAYIENGDMIQVQQSKSCITDIDLLPMMDYDFYSEYLEFLVPRVYTSRGCSNNCIYCTADNSLTKVYRKRSVKNVVDEIEKIVKLYHKKFFVMGDLEFLSDLEHSKAVCNEIIKRKLEVNWWCQVFPPNVNEEIVALMKSAGCIQIALGIESNNESSLKQLEKNNHTNVSIEACKIIKSNHLQVQAYLMLGLPSDTIESSISMIKFAGELINQGLVDVTHLSTMVPYPGSKLYENSEKYGVRIEHGKNENYYMNCDYLGATIPSYDTLYMTGKEIYALWLFGLSYYTECFKRKREYRNHYKKVYDNLGLNKISVRNVQER